MTSISPSPASSLHPTRVSPRSASFRTGAARILESLGRRVIRGSLHQLDSGRVHLIEAFRRDASPIDPPDGLTVRIHDPAFYSAAAFGGSIGIAEAYMDGLWDCDELPRLIEFIAANRASVRTLESPVAKLLSPLSRVAYFLERNTRAGSRRNIAAHYDLGNEFFSTFLDTTMTYSSAIFENGADTLELAQIEKVDRACRKLRLRPSDHLLEIGTGWGALAIHAAREYGCRVTTTTISAEQHRFTSQRIHAANLQDRVTVLQRDYRDLRGQFDKLVSIEMVEAVGAENLADYFRICSRCLKPDGAALIQCIVIQDRLFADAARRRDFLKKYIFPGSCLPSVAAILDATRRATDFSLWHLEDIGPHYARTLQLWRERFMSRLDDVRRLGFDDRFIRMWEFYLAYCEGTFRSRCVGDVQLLFTKPRSSIPPASPYALGAPDE
jgi:cyclopropane-fatty-acyl-phospholipid synthase